MARYMLIANSVRAWKKKVTGKGRNWCKPNTINQRCVPRVNVNRLNKNKSAQLPWVTAMAIKCIGKLAFKVTISPPACAVQEGSF